MMKLVCTIGTQGLSDGRRFSRGEVYEVDDDTASTLISARYAKAYVEPEVVVDDVVADAAIIEEHASHFGDGDEESTTSSTATKPRRGRKPKA